MVLRRTLFVVAMLGAVALANTLALASVSGAGARQATPRPLTAAPVRSPVEVDYAASLLRVLGSDLGPRFDAASGDRFVGVAGGSLGLAHQLADGLRQADVLVSAGTQAQSVLDTAGRAHWYAVFAHASLVLGYNPGTPFARALQHHPWYDVVTRPGFRLGRTDPAVDPKGQLTITALRQTAAAVHRSAVEAVAGDDATVFPEEALLGRLESGQLDAAFLYADEARAAGIPTVGLAPAHLSMPFALTILAGAPHPAAALAFVQYLLSPAGHRLLQADGLTTGAPLVHGAVPGRVQHLVGAHAREKWA